MCVCICVVEQGVGLLKELNFELETWQTWWGKKEPSRPSCFVASTRGNQDGINTESRGVMWGVRNSDRLMGYCSSHQPSLPRACPHRCCWCRRHCVRHMLNIMSVIEGRTLDVWHIYRHSGIWRRGRLLLPVQYFYCI